MMIYSAPPERRSVGMPGGLPSNEADNIPTGNRGTVVTVQHDIPADITWFGRPVRAALSPGIIDSRSQVHR